VAAPLATQNFIDMPRRSSVHVGAPRRIALGLGKINRTTSTRTGGTSDLVAKVERSGAKTVVIDTKATFGL
jgi:hypothetical protein